MNETERFVLRLAPGRLVAMKAIKAGFSNAWPFAVVGFALALNLVWVGFLAYALFTVAQLAL